MPKLNLHNRECLLLVLDANMFFKNVDKFSQEFDFELKC